MVTESELESLIQKHFGGKVNKEIRNNVKRIYDVGEKHEGNGERTIIYVKEIFQKSFDTGMGEDLIKKLSDINWVNWKDENIYGAIVLTDYIYCKKNYGRVMAEAVIDTFIENEESTFNVSKLNYAKEMIDNVYKDYVGNFLELKKKTKERIQSLFE